MKAPFQSIPVVAGALPGVGMPGGQYAGLCLHAVGAAACVVRIWDGTSASGTLLDVVELTGSGVGSFASYVLDGEGGHVTTGIFVELVSGTLPEGSIRIF
jgi:hypothetical protein